MANGGIIGPPNLTSFGKNTITTKTSSGSLTTQPGTRVAQTLIVAGGAGGGGGSGGGGGGGAGGYGLNGTTSPDSKSFPTAMNGGIGREFGVYGFDSLPTSYGTPGLSPTGRWFAGGGGGGSGLTDPDPLAYGLGGYGGGGDGGVSRLPITYELAATSGEDGLTNTGGGGGSPGSYTNPRLHSWLGSGDGGPGIVIIGYVYQ